MDVDLRQLRYFVAVAEELHFSRAAARLHLDQPTLSRHVRRLEERLGVDLLERTTRHVALTNAGRVFLDKARETLVTADAAVGAARDAAAGLGGVLRVGMMVQIAPDFRGKALRSFEERYASVEVRPLGGYPYIDPTCGLAAGETDVAFVWEPIPHPGISTLALFDEPRCFVVAKDHPLATRDFLSLADVEDEAFFGFPPDCYDDPTVAAWTDFFQLQPRPDGVRRPVGAIVTNRDEWLDALARGRAISTAPGSSEWLTPVPGVRYVPAVGIEPVTVALAWRSDRPSPVVANFVELVRELRDGRE